MPTENTEIGTIYIADENGNTHEIVIPIKLTRKSKRIWGKIFMMPKYIVTEWCFPRKKKRGTMRRNRRKGGAE